MIFILCAMKCEASPLINLLDLKPSESDKGTYTAPGFHLVITGIGPENMKKTMYGFPAAARDDVYINIGVCGCADTSVKKGTAYAINEIRNSDGSRPQYPDMLAETGLPEAGCTTYGAPKLDIDCPTLLADMEAYEFYRTAVSRSDSSSVHVVKVVSDHMNLSGLTKNDISGYIQSNRDIIRKFINRISALSEKRTSLEYSAYYDKYRFTGSIRIELDKLNEYHRLRYGRIPGSGIYGGFPVPSDKKESMRIFNDIRNRLL
jgi:hypothetical protein